MTPPGADPTPGAPAAGPAARPVAPMLELDGIRAGYGALPVLHDVSLCVAPGEIVALMGANGAGKSTTLRTIMGLLGRPRGRVRYCGDDVTGWPPEALVARGLSLVPEGRGMLRELTVVENLRIGAYSRRDRAEEAETMAEVFEVFPILAERADQPAGQLSGGQQQMLAIARALMSRPRLLLVDEVSLGLSPVVTDTVFALLSRIRDERGVAMLLVEQNVAALDLADRAYVLEHGQIVDHAAGSEVRSMQQRLRAAYLGRTAIGEAVGRTGGGIGGATGERRA